MQAGRQTADRQEEHIRDYVQLADPFDAKRVACVGGLRQVSRSRIVVFAVLVVPLVLGSF